MRSITLVVLLALLGAPASAATIDFEGVVADDGQQQLGEYSGYSEDGFLFKRNYCYWTDCPYSITGKDFYNTNKDFYKPPSVFDSAFMAWCGYDWSNTGYWDGFNCSESIVELTHLTSVFSLSSVDFAITFGEWGGTGRTYTLDIWGWSSGGNGEHKTVEISDDGVTTVSFDANWSNLSRVSFEAVNCDAAMDNIVVTAVPVPAAFWLFGSALAGLGWLRRKKSA